MNKKQSKLIRKRYDRISPFYSIMDRMIRPSWRSDILKDLHGHILEVGVGTGGNLLYYSSDAHVTGIDFSPKMLSKAYEKVNKAQAIVKLKEMDIEQMTFSDNTFDFVVSTCVFCSVPDSVTGLKEIRRVVKPDGKIVMLEHMRSENLFIGRVLDVINPLTVRLTGANVNRKTIQNIEQAGLRVEKQTFLMTTIMRKLILSPNKSNT